MGVQRQRLLSFARLSRCAQYQCRCRLEEQDDWTREQAASNRSTLWAAMRLLHAQVRCLAARPLPHALLATAAAAKATN
jgi:hypothetical protein